MIPRRPAIDTSTLGPRISTSYSIHDIGSPPKYDSSSAYPVIPAGFNNTGQIYGEYTQPNLNEDYYYCVVYTGNTFFDVTASASPLVTSCLPKAISDADPKTGRYALVGIADYPLDGLVPDVAVGFVAQLGPGAPSYHVYKGYSPSAVFGIDGRGRIVVTTIADAIHPSTFNLLTNYTATTANPTLVPLEPDCQQILPGCVYTSAFTPRIPFSSPFLSQSVSSAGFVIGIDQNGMPAIVAIGSPRAKAIAVKIPAGSTVLAIDDVGELLYVTADGSPYIYAIASANSRFIPNLPGCSYEYSINITSNGSILGYADNCSDQTKNSAYFINVRVHGTRSIMPQIPRPANLQNLTIFALNDRGQLLFGAHNTSTNAYDWGTLDPPGFSAQSVTRGLLR